jgi:beta-lactamase class D
MKKILLLLIALTISACAQSKNTSQKSDTADNIPNKNIAPVIKMPELKKYFDDNKVKGCIVIYDFKNNIFTYHDSIRANKEFIPASTFKIPNSLFSLEAGSVKDENELIKWDGKKRNREEWNQDTDMKMAFKYSTVWFYQECARRIGEKRMQHYIDTLNYGNKNISGGLDHFWLDGAIRITAMQQIFLLTNIFQNKVPFSQRNIDILKKIMILEQTPEYTFRGKTGTALGGGNSIGWLVGYLETDKNVYFYALNLELDEQSNDFKFNERFAIVKSIFNDMGLTKFVVE